MEGLKKQLMGLLKPVLEAVEAKDPYAIFKCQVSKTLIVDYSKFVDPKKEVWTGKIRSKLKNLAYSSGAEFLGDMEQLVLNAKAYNAVGKGKFGNADIINLAEALLVVCKERLEDIREGLRAVEVQMSEAVKVAEPERRSAAEQPQGSKPIRKRSARDREVAAAQYLWPEGIEYDRGGFVLPHDFVQKTWPDKEKFPFDVPATVEVMGDKLEGRPRCKLHRMLLHDQPCRYTLAGLNSVLKGFDMKTLRLMHCELCGDDGVHLVLDQPLEELHEPQAHPLLVPYLRDRYSTRVGIRYARNCFMIPLAFVRTAFAPDQQWPVELEVKVQVDGETLASPAKGRMKKSFYPGGGTNQTRYYLTGIHDALRSCNTERIKLFEIEKLVGPVLKLIIRVPEGSPSPDSGNVEEQERGQVEVGQPQATEGPGFVNDEDKGHKLCSMAAKRPVEGPGAAASGGVKRPRGISPLSEVDACESPDPQPRMGTVNDEVGPHDRKVCNGARSGSLEVSLEIKKSREKMTEVIGTSSRERTRSPPLPLTPQQQMLHIRAGSA